jgi:peptidoglycan LD-endopeptidase CwlK
LIIFFSAAYFMLAVLLGALVLSPAARAFATRNAGQLGRLAAHGVQSSQSALSSTADSSRASFAATRTFLLRRRKLVLCTAAVIALPPLTVALFHRSTLFRREGVSRASDENIEALLAGEQLVPPPPLPPEIFATREVELIRPALKDASRDWGPLDPDFKARLLHVYKIMHEQYGYELALLEGYRSPERQNRLAQMGHSVTNAAAWQSYHQYGLAADNAFLRDGKLVISEKDPWAMRGYQLYGQVAEQVGLTWGGRWKMMDLGHVEYHKPGFKLGRKPDE